MQRNPSGLDPVRIAQSCLRRAKVRVQAIQWVSGEVHAIVWPASAWAVDSAIARCDALGVSLVLIPRGAA